MRIFDRLDASLDLDPAEASVLEQVRRLATERLLPRAARHDRDGSCPEDNIAEMNALGMNAIFVPEAHGGMNLSYAVYLACVREISRACASTGIIWATTFHAMKPVLEFGSDALKARVMPRVAEGAIGALCITEAEAGSDATGMTTRLRSEGSDTIVIDGAKSFISNGDIADFLLVFGKWSGIAGARDAMTAILVEKGTPGFATLARERKMGHRAAPTCGLVFDGCRVPRANLVGQPGDGLAILLASLNHSRPSVAAHALGIARAAFEDAVVHVNQRRQSGRRIVEFQGIQFLLADLATDLAMTEAWLWRLAGMVDAGVTDFAVEASMLKMRASDVAMRLSTEAVQLHGGYGYVEDFRVERLMRDAKITQIWEGTNQIHRQFIGRHFIVRQDR